MRPPEFTGGNGLIDAVWFAYKRLQAAGRRKRGDLPRLPWRFITRFNEAAGIHRRKPGSTARQG